LSDRKGSTASRRWEAISDDRPPSETDDGADGADVDDEGTQTNVNDERTRAGGERTQTDDNRTTGGDEQMSTQQEETNVDRDIGPSYDGSLRSQIRNHRIHLGVIAALGLYPFVYSALTMAPVVGSTFDLFLPRMETMVFVIVIGLFAMSFDFVSGYTGYLSFGHALFYGTGAYFVLMAANGLVPFLSAETPYLLLVVYGALLATVFAVVVGVLSFRLTGVYFAMLTLGFAELANIFIRDWSYLGVAPESGISFGSGFALGVPYVDALQIRIGALVGDSFHSVFGLFGMAESTARATVSFYAIGLVVICCYFAMQRIIHSPFGRVMVAIRENEERAKAVGYDTYWYKLGAFSIGAFFAGVAGALAAGYRRGASPENSFDLFVTADALLAAIIGGFGTLAGPLYGHLFHESLDGLLSTESHGLARYLQQGIPDGVIEATLVGEITLNTLINGLLAGRAELYLGLVFIFFVLVVPRGFLGTLRDRIGGTAAEKLPDHIERYLRGFKK